MVFGPKRSVLEEEDPSSVSQKHSKNVERIQFNTILYKVKNNLMFRTVGLFSYLLGLDDGTVSAVESPVVATSFAAS